MTEFLLIPGSSASWPNSEKSQKAKKVRVQTRVSLQRILVTAVGVNPRRLALGTHSGISVMANRWRLPDGGHLDPVCIRHLAAGVLLLIPFSALRIIMVSLAMGKIDSCPFPPDDVAQLKEAVIDAAAGFGHQIERRSGDRTDVQIDYRFLDLLLRVAEDPETGLGEYAQGVKVGPGTRMPRLPALFKPKKKWRLASKVDPLDYLEHATTRLSKHSKNRCWKLCTIKLRAAKSSF